MKKIIVWSIAGLALLAAGAAAWRLTRPAKPVQSLEEIKPFFGPIQIAISTTGVVEPQNRLEIKPPIGGRIEKILVKEGQRVKTGQILALMSSTERAALLDAARLQAPDKLEYWENVYKATPLLAPIDGKVIVRAVEPGQTVTASDTVFVLSDRLIVKANVDETDIGSVAVGQQAVISLDAYPDVKVKGLVDHISFESTVVNNVTIYNVDIVPVEVPDVFRSGMSANIQIISARRENVLQVPLAAVKTRNGKAFVLVKNDSPRGFGPRPVKLGISDYQNAEIVSGLTAADVVVVVKGNAAAGGKESGAESGTETNRASSPLVPNFHPGRGGRR